MDNMIRTLCETIKKIMSDIKSTQPTAITLVVGKTNEGKSTALQQANLNQITITPNNEIEVYYNQNGIFLCLSETWLNHHQSLAVFFKKINNCHKNVFISGLLLFVDASNFLNIEPPRLLELCKEKILLLRKIGHNLAYSLNIAVMLTKLDCLAGFSEFFQTEHEANEVLGFSIDSFIERSKFLATYKAQFETMVEILGQKIISKLHPARSSSKRTLIREFPLQLASLRVPIQALLQNIPNNLFTVKALYFCSAKQGGISIDRLNKKIQHEYALTVQDTFPQSNNYRAYFINSALLSFQQLTQLTLPKNSSNHNNAIFISSSFFVLFVLGIFGYQYNTTATLLDEASKELLTYENLITKTENTSAFYHLSLAENKINSIPKSLFFVPVIQSLKTDLKLNIQDKLKNNFLPELVAQIEDVLLTTSETPLARYQALKVYLMLNNPHYFSQNEIENWFQEYYHQKNPQNLDDKPLFVLKSALNQPFQPLAINQHLVTDVRNYLNALPATYLYYSLAKNYFPKQKDIINFAGFDLVNHEIPTYFTKPGFYQVLADLPTVVSKLEQENWILERQDLSNLKEKLEIAYSYDYALWWTNFTQQTQPQHYQSLQQAQQLMLVLHQEQSFEKLINFIQINTSPDSGDKSSLFNQEIAKKFSDLNLLAHSTSVDTTQNILELERFVSTLALIKDDAQTIFNITKNRFQNPNATDALTVLYNKSRQLPEPISSWAKQVADDTWYILIRDTKQYINKEWQQKIFDTYQNKIAERYPFDSYQKEEVAINDFDKFFAPQGTLNSFVNNYLKPFLDTSQPEWRSKELNGYLIPFSNTALNELIRANVISNMFFHKNSSNSKVEFSLQKINLDPIVAKFQLAIGNTVLNDNQSSESLTNFTWPEINARLSLKSIDNKNFDLEERGVWAFFKMLQKVNVLVDNNDSSSLQILFEVNGNSGRYLLKTQNQINPFSPGILAGFSLNQEIC